MGVVEALCLGWPHVSTSIARFVPCPRRHQNSASFPSRQTESTGTRLPLVFSFPAAGLTRSCRSSIHDSKREEKLCDPTKVPARQLLDPGLSTPTGEEEQRSNSVPFSVRSLLSRAHPAQTDAPLLVNTKRGGGCPTFIFVRAPPPRQERNPKYNFHNM